MSPGLPWSLLGIAATNDVKVIRRAYAERLKTMDLDADVDGYAALRDARDAALRLARRDRQGTGLPLADHADMPCPAEPDRLSDRGLPQGEDSPWPHAAPDLPGAWQVDAALSIAPVRPQGPFLDVRAGACTADPSLDRVIAVPATAALSPPFLAGHADGPSLGLTPGQTVFDRLAAVLLPGEPARGEAMEDGEVREAARRLQAVLDEAAVSDIARHHQIENWLAGLLAEAWPRSAPLLEEATSAFGWEREWGKVDARPAVDYLGSRLRGYRFQQAVLRPDHRFHRAWRELSRPGRAGAFKFLRVGRGPVEALLTGIRKHFPEVESHLDEQRVASWEQRGTGSPMTAAYLIIFGLIVLGAFARNFDLPARNTPPPPPIVVEAKTTEPDSAMMSTVVAAAVADSFDGVDANWLWMHQPDLAQTITANARYSLEQGEDGEEVTRKVTEIVRERVYSEGRLLDGADFETTMRLRLDQLRAARAHGTATCVELLGSSWLDGTVPVPDSLRARERRFATALAKKGLLKAPEPREAASAPVPGELVGRVMAATGLSEKRVAAAMQRKGSDAHRCAVAIALLEAALGWRGNGRKAILMTL